MLWFPEYFHLIEKQNSNTRCNTSCGSVSYNDNKEYLDNVYVSLATIPGLLSGIILINILGAKVLLGKILYYHFSVSHKGITIHTPEFLISFEAWVKLAQRWLMCAPLGIHLEPINKELMLLVTIYS